MLTLYTYCVYDCPVTNILRFKNFKVAIFENDKLITMDTDSQICIHNKTGGVVPEVAAREHANNIFRVLTNVLKQAKLTLEDIDYI